MTHDLDVRDMRAESLEMELKTIIYLINKGTTKPEMLLNDIKYICEKVLK